MPNVYFFANGQADGSGQMKDILGGKGASLHEMTKLGIPVPPGFTIAASLCTQYLTDRKLPEELCTEVTAAMGRLESATGRGFGDSTAPLLVAVRSGAKVSMPGMMDTILNLGLNDQTAAALAEQTGNPRFAYDSYRRFVQMYAHVVPGIGRGNGRDPIDDAIEKAKFRRNVDREIDLDVGDLQDLVRTMQDIIERETGVPFPQDPWDQLWRSVEAVFQSWNARRARDYRRLHRIPHDLGTAVNVVAMVFGNMGEDSATGVVFTRDPSTGEPRLFGEYLVNAQGEDVVAGVRTPEPIDAMADTLPRVLDELRTTCST
ncbi:MAG: pyruvate, phosphate dikinase, partial [Gemmatimonadetes bacterium]|nr:pyruvate, phosphate dikinase [Gemmatimonadota bacterium]